ncbi:amidohydrolase family protein [bacterium]|nr:amidohydrolase family protein [bacterium]
MGGLVVDTHAHLVGLDRDGHGCVVSETMKHKLSTRVVLKAAGASLSEPPADVDRKYVDLLRRQLDTAPSVDRVVLFAFDGVYRDDGSLDESRTHLLVPNDFAFEVAASHPKVWVGASVNPYRKDALAELERCAARGAVLVKWIPSTQGFDPADPRCEAFYGKLVELGLPLLSHVGTEFALPPVDKKLGAIERLEAAMRAGVRVIVPHAGNLKLLGDAADFERLMGLLEKHPQVLLNESALALVHRRRRLFRLLARKEIHGRVLHGSDFPLPVHPWAFVPQLGLAATKKIAALESIFEKDVVLKRALGAPEGFFTQASSYLKIPERDRFIEAAR